MRTDDHCAESLRLFGQEFRKVHEWLDELFGTPIGARHRRKRHHLAGVEEVRRRWGDRAAEAARRHVMSDLQGEGWRETDPFPRDEQDYVSMGFF
jgi:hypothetical protein